MNNCQFLGHLTSKTNYHLDDWGTYVVFKIKEGDFGTQLVLFGDHESSKDLVEMARAVHASIEYLSKDKYISDPWTEGIDQTIQTIETVEDEIPF